jgi:hypothetical protein
MAVIINKNTQTLIDVCKEVGLEVNVEKTKYMSVSRDQNAGQNRELKIGNKSLEKIKGRSYSGDLPSGTELHRVSRLVSLLSVFKNIIFRHHITFFTSKMPESCLQ